MRRILITALISAVLLVPGLALAKGPKAKTYRFTRIDATKPCQLAIVVDPSIGSQRKLTKAVVDLLEETLSGLHRRSRVTAVLAVPKGSGKVVFSRSRTTGWKHLVRTFQNTLKRRKIAAPAPRALPASMTLARRKLQLRKPAKRHLVVVLNGLAKNSEAYKNLSLPVGPMARGKLRVLFVTLGDGRYPSLIQKSAPAHVDYIAWNPRLKGPLLFKGHARRKTRRYRNYTATSSVRLQKRLVAALCKNGSAAMRKGRYNEAYRRYRRVLALDPTNLEARRKMGIIRAKMGDYGGAQRTVDYLRRNHGESEAEKYRKALNLY